MACPVFREHSPAVDARKGTETGHFRAQDQLNQAARDAIPSRSQRLVDLSQDGQRLLAPGQPDGQTLVLRQPPLGRLLGPDLPTSGRLVTFGALVPGLMSEWCNSSRPAASMLKRHARQVSAARSCCHPESLFRRLPGEQTAFPSGLFTCPQRPVNLPSTSKGTDHVCHEHFIPPGVVTPR